MGCRRHCCSIVALPGRNAAAVRCRRGAAAEQKTRRSQLAAGAERRVLLCAARRSTTILLRRPPSRAAVEIAWMDLAGGPVGLWWVGYPVPGPARSARSRSLEMPPPSRQSNGRNEFCSRLPPAEAPRNQEIGIARRRRPAVRRLRP
jgi:hypothetical protein